MFFDALGPTRSALLTHVSADGAEWIHAVVREKAPQAAICLDPFHVVMWATKALDKVRRRTLEQAGDQGPQRPLGGRSRTRPTSPPDQRGSLARIKTTNTALYRAYLLKEQLRAVFATKGRRGERTARRVDRLGPPLPTPRVRHTRPHHQTVPAADLEHPPQARRVERAIRGHQHPHPSPDQTRLRLPLTRSAHRHGHAHPRRTQTRTSRPEMTHENVRRPLPQPPEGNRSRSEAFPRSTLAPEPSSCHLYAGHRQDSRQVASWLLPEQQRDPGFDANHAISTPHRWFTHVHLLGPHLTHSRRAFSATLTTTTHSPQQLAVVYGHFLQNDRGGPTSITNAAPHQK